MLRDPDDPRSGYRREREWHLPAPITLALKDEARRALADLERNMLPAPKEAVRKWLASLGLLTAGRMTREDAQAKISAYAPLLVHPAICYTQASLEEAGRRFQFFPSYGEVAAFLDEKFRPLRNLHARLRAVAAAGVTPSDPAPPRYEALTPEQRAEHDRFMDEFRGKHDAQPPQTMDGAAAPAADAAGVSDQSIARG